MKNPNCDNDRCLNPRGEIRKLPTGSDGNALLCRHCYMLEIRYRMQRNRELTGTGSKFDTPSWESLKIYSQGS